MARTMIVKRKLPKYLWVKATSTSGYILNRALVRLILKKTPCELWKGRKLIIGH